MDNFSQRTIALIGLDCYQKLKQSDILIVGVGGVGGFVAEFLARAGVGSMTVADGDIVEEANINRQVIATTQTLGIPKVDATKERLLSINPDINVFALRERFNSDSKAKFFDKKYDFVVDAIDSVVDKTELICSAKEKFIPIVSAMGAGNRFDIPAFEVKDVYKTENDGLAKVMRKKLREREISDVPCVCAKSNSNRVEGVIGSISYYPAACASVVAAYVINKLIYE